MAASLFLHANVADATNLVRVGQDEGEAHFPRVSDLGVGVQSTTNLHAPGYEKVSEGSSRRDVQNITEWESRTVRRSK